MIQEALEVFANAMILVSIWYIFRAFRVEEPVKQRQPNAKPPMVLGTLKQ